MAELNDIQLRIIVQGTGLDNLQRINDQLAKATGNISTSSAAAADAGSKWRQFGDSLSELERRFDAVFRAASHLQALGRDLTGMGEAGLGMLRASVDAWGDYEFGVHRAAGALGIFDTTSPIFHRLQQAIDETAQEARLFPAEEIAKAVYFWGSATGQTVKSNKDLAIVMDGLLPIMQTAAITETDYETAIKGTYQIIQQYKLGLTRLATEQDVASGAAKRVGEEMSNTRDITEKLMMITQNTAVEYSDLIESFRYTGSIAPSLGVKYEELAVVLGRLGDLGIRGSTAGRALQQTFTKLLDPTVRASKALNEAWEANFGLGKSFNDMVFPNGEFIGLTEYVDQLADVTEDMTMKERGNLVAIMTTQNELRTMIPLIEDQIAARKSGISVYDQEKYALENASKQFEQTMHLLEISWKGTMGYLRESIMPVVRLIGAEVARLATPFVEAFGVIVQQIKAWLDTHPEIVKWFVQIVAVASVMAILAGAVFTALGVILAFGAGIGFVIGGMARFAGIFTRFFPIVGAVIAIITALATNFGGLRDAAERVIRGIMAVWDAMNHSAAGSGLSVIERLGAVLLPALEGAAKIAAWMLNRLADALEWIARTPGAVKVVEGIVSALGLFMAAGFIAKIGGIAFSIATLGGNALGAAPYVQMLASSMARFFSISSLWPPNLVRNIKDMNAAFSMTASDAKGKFLGAIGAMKGAMTGMLAHVRITSAGMSTAIRGVLIATGIGAIIVAVTLLAQAWMENWGDIQGKFADAVAWIGARFDELVVWITTTWTTITTNIGNAVTNIVNFFRDLPANIGTFLTQVWDNITTWVGNIVTTITSLPGLALDGIVTGFNSIMEWLGTWWTSLGENTTQRIFFLLAYIAVLPIKGLIIIVEGFVAIWNWFVEWWENLTAAIGEWVSGIVAVLLDWFGKLPGSIADIFSMLWTGFVTWWENLMASIGRWVTSVVNTILDWLGKLPGRIATLFGQIWTNVSTWWGQFITNLGTWANNAITAVINFFQLLPGRVLNFFRDLFNNVSNWFSGEFVPNIGTWTNNAITSVVDFFRELPGRVMNVVDNLTVLARTFLRNLPGNIWDAIVSVGTGIVNGIKQGLLNAWESFKRFVKDMFTGIVNGVKAALGIASPSKVFAEIGTQMIQGLAVGVRKNDDAVKAVDDQVHSIIDSARQLRTEGFGELGSNFAFSSDDEKRLTIEHRVSSPDGTVNSASQEQLREIFTAEEFVSALEHMATVG